jgi:hypothetical protein
MKLIPVLLLAILSACATQVPKATNAPAEPQMKLMAAQHWGGVAKDAVDRTRWALSKKGVDLNTPLYISENNNTVFDHAFRKYLISHFIEAGSVVATNSTNALEVKFESQVIKHAQAIKPQEYGYKPGFLTAGVVGFWILRDVFDGFGGGKALQTLALSGAYDGYKATNPSETGVEVLLTTSITNNNQYIMLNADAYYIENEESRLFEPCKGRNRKLCR